MDRDYEYDDYDDNYPSDEGSSAYEYDREMERYHQEEDELRRIEHEMRVQREREKWGDPYELDPYADVPPLTDEEQRLYKEYVLEERRKKKDEELARQRILEEREQSELRERERMRTEINNWKRKKGIPIPELPTMPLLTEYRMMLTEVTKEREVQRRIDEDVRQKREALQAIEREKENERRQERARIARKKAWQERQRKKQGMNPQKKKVVDHARVMAERRAEKRKKKKELAAKRVVTIVPRETVIEQPKYFSDEEEIEVIEEFPRHIPLRTLDAPFFPVTAAKKKRRKRKKKGKNVLSLAEFIAQTDTQPECRILLRYSWGSKHVPAGEGDGEKKGFGDNLYKLDRIKDWRKKLSSLWKSPFTLDGKRWQTVEHYVQSRKFDHEPGYAHQFSMDSGSKMSTFPLMAKFAGSKTGKFKGKYLRPKRVKPRSDFGNDYQNILMLATYAKFSQNEHLYHLLNETEEACLYRSEKGKRDARALWLEKVRECFRMMNENSWEIVPLNSKMM
jgi:predicted NAD-dependent protein-ADP-ribosyltransferase YbiA (DUF1768 family)